MILYFRNTKTAYWFILGMVITAFPFIFVLNKLGVKDFNFKYFLLAGAITSLAISFIYEYVSDYRRFKTLSEYWDKSYSENFNEAREKYSVKGLSGSQFDEQIDKQANYLDELNSMSRQAFQKKFNLSNIEWENFYKRNLMEVFKRAKKINRLYPKV